ncbi:hypothetical protein T459_34048 [Capsicum annuum]|uniref:Uncharacterized protein n=1 Tax=Capsicum annuum TaxID=4072 RepID=A0A2G2XX53_CAPAN|nr:hypothetical protein T459_34048 [Capsicum annuum]
MPNSGEANSSIPLHPQLLNVIPLSWYIHVLALLYHIVIMLHHHQISMLVQLKLKLVQLHRPNVSTLSSMLGSACNGFFSACPAREEQDDLINHANGGVVLTGSALLGKVGPLIGSADMAEFEDAYVFRVSLPSVARDESYNGICIHSKTVDAYLFLVEETKVVHSLPNEKKQVQPFLLLEFMVSKKVFTSVQPSQRVLMPLNRRKSNLLCRRMMELPSLDLDPPATLDLPFQPRF